MTASKCIRKKAEAGLVDKGKADEAARLFDEMEMQLRHQNHPTPTQLAAKATADALKWEKKRVKRAALQTAKVQAEIRNIILNAEDAEAAALALLDFDVNRKFVSANVHHSGEAIRSNAYALMADFFREFDSKLAGLDVAIPGHKAKRQAALREIVHELFGRKTGSESAKEIAGALNKAFEYLRQTGNAVGLTIPKLEDWGLPQKHNRAMVNSVKEKAWIDFIEPLLNRQKMTDLDTGQPISESKLRRVLAEIYEDIVTDGFRNVKPGGGVGRSISSKRAQHRFLVFKNSDAWLQYHERFGDGDVFQVVLNHLNSMSRDIGMAKVLGPNPDATIRYMERLVTQAKGEKALKLTGKKGMKAARRITQAQWKIRGLYAAVSGGLDQVQSQGWANWLEGNRNILTSSLLSGAWFSAISDMTFSGITANVNGLSASKVWARHLKLMSPTSSADKALAARLGFINENGLGVAIAQMRYVGEALGPEWTRRIADTSLRISLLSPWTQWGRTAFGMEFLSFATGQVGRSFKDLHPKLKRSFESVGLNADDWDLIRKTPLWSDERSGSEWINIHQVAGDPSGAESGALFQRRFDAANKLRSLISQETELAIPSVTPRVRVLTTGGAVRGSWPGEIMRNSFMFKSFPLTVALTHLRRAVNGNISGPEKAKYFAQLIIGTAVLGAFGEQLHQLKAGRDPLSMNPTTENGRAFWLKGMARGGGLGVFGDFIFSDMHRFGGGLGQWAAGPVIGGQLGGVGNLILGNLRETTIEGQPTNMGREMTRFIRLMAPGHTLWYGSLAFERIIMDEIQKQLDPNYAASFRAVQERSRRDFNQSFFSPPGSGFPPRRGPDLERALQ